MVVVVRIFVTPWTVACRVPLSMGFSRREYWSGLSFPSPGDSPDPGIEPLSPVLQAVSFLRIPGKEASQLTRAVNTAAKNYYSLI